jgi:hypothetical protein
MACQSFPRFLAVFPIPGPDQNGDFPLSEFFCNFKTDTPVGPGDQRHPFLMVLHSFLLLDY